MDWGASTQDFLDSDGVESLINEFESKLSTYDKRLFSIYFRKDLKKGREISKHLNISISSAYIIAGECKKIEENFKKWLTKQV